MPGFSFGSRNFQSSFRDAPLGAGAESINPQCPSCAAFARKRIGLVTAAHGGYGSGLAQEPRAGMTDGKHPPSAARLSLHLCDDGEPLDALIAIGVEEGVVISK